MFFALTAFSQVSWNVKAGMNISNWTEDSSADPKVGFRIGAGMEYSFSKIWSIQPSVLLSSKGVKGDTYDMGKATINQLYLEVPVLGAARFSMGNKNSIVVSAGPYMAYGIGGQISAKDSGIKVSVDTFGKTGDYEGLNRFDAGLAAGVAFELGKIVLGMETQYGLIELIDDSDVTNVSVSFNVGFKF